MLGKKMTSTRSAFAQFLDDEIKQRDISVNEFARQVGVAPQTIHNYLEGKDRAPSTKVLARVAAYTKTDAAILFALAFDLPILGFDAETMLFAKSFSRLSQEDRRKLRRFVVDFLGPNGSKEGE